MASLWEIALKMARGKLSVPEDLPRRLAAAGFEILPVTAQHAWDVRSTPNPLAAADSFDRMLSCQGRRDGLTLATRDKAPPSSGAEVIRAQVHPAALAISALWISSVRWVLALSSFCMSPLISSRASASL